MTVILVTGINKHYYISVTFACDIYLPICMRKLDTHRRPATSNTSNGDEMLPKTPQHIVHRTHNKCGGTQQNRACLHIMARESDGKIISRIGLVYVLLNP